VAGHRGEAHALEQPGHLVGVGARELDELEAVGAQRIVEQVGHAPSPPYGLVW
jgi:hypothetical protein